MKLSLELETLGVNCKNLAMTREEARQVLFDRMGWIDQLGFATAEGLPNKPDEFGWRPSDHFWDAFHN